MQGWMVAGREGVLAENVLLFPMVMLPQIWGQKLFTLLFPPAGWFSLNVPSGLTLYWFVNNILSTGQQYYLKKTTVINMPETASASASSAPSGTYVKPKEERVKKITGA